MPHSNPEFLALRALGESGGPAADEDHLAGCAECQAELARLAQVVAVARGEHTAVALEQPPAGLWDRIAAATETGSAPARAARPSPAPGVAPPPAGRPALTRLARGRPAGPAPRRRPAGRPRWLRSRVAVAAAAGIAVGAGAAAGLAHLSAAPRPAAAAAVAQVPLRALPQFPQWQGASGTAVMSLAPAARVLNVTLHAPRKPGFYEVWLLGRDGVSMISLGDLSSAHAGSFTIPPGADLRFYSRIDISLQPFDGSPVHAKASVVRGDLPPAAQSAG